MKDTFSLTPTKARITEAAHPNRQATSARALALGFTLTAVHVVWMVTLAELRGFIAASAFTLVSTIIFLFFWLILVNKGVARWRPGRELSQGELLVIFSLVTVGSTLAGTDMLQVLVHSLVEGSRYLDGKPVYGESVTSYLANWMRVDNTAIAQAFNSGTSNLFTDGQARAFLGPIAWWSICIASFILMSFSANTLLRRQWTRNERLNFPVTQLPIAMTAPSAGGLLGNRVFQIGFTFAGLLTMLNGLHHFWPAIPGMSTGNVSDMAKWSTDPIWRSMGGTPISLHLYAIGMAFVVPLDLLFSLWAFTWIWKLQRMIGTACGVTVSGWAIGSGWPHYAHQMIGCWMVLLGFTLWTARHHLRMAVLQALQPHRGTNDAGDVVAYRTALIGLGIGMVGMSAFLLALGITPQVVIPYVVMLLGFCVSIARIRAESGPPIQDILDAGPDRVIYTFSNAMMMGSRSWVNFRIWTYWMHRYTPTTYPSGAHIDALRMGEVAGGMNRKLLIALLIAGIGGGILTMWADAYLGFLRPRWQYAPGQCASICSWKTAVNSLQDITPRPNWGEMTSVGVGAGLTTAIFLIRGMGVNLPLHPIGYLLTGGFALQNFWIPILIAWIVKLAILRYGGLTLYRRTLPFFLGLILGQFIIGVGWQLLGMIAGINVYSFYS